MVLNLQHHQKHQEGLLKSGMLGLNTRVSDSVVLGWSSKFAFSTSSLVSGADDAGPRITLRKNTGAEEGPLAFRSQVIPVSLSLNFLICAVGKYRPNKPSAQI